MASLWSRRSMIVFLLVGFGIPWLGWTAIAIWSPAPPLRTVLFYLGDFMTVAGLLATWVAGGGTALRSLLGRAVAIRAPIGWVLFAIFLPLVWLGIPALWYGARHGGIGRLDPAGLVAYVAPATLMAFTTGPLGEEAGWRGYFLPRLLGRYGPLPASIILGLIWGIWHYPLYVKSVFSTLAGGSSFVAHTVCFSVLMMVLWAFTNGSVFWAIILHYTVNVTPRVLSALFPDLHVPDGATDALELGVLVTLVVLVLGLVRPARLAARISEVMERLAPEAVLADRSRTRAG